MKALGQRSRPQGLVGCGLLRITVELEVWPDVIVDAKDSPQSIIPLPKGTTLFIPSQGGPADPSCLVNLSYIKLRGLWLSFCTVAAASRVGIHGPVEKSGGI